MKSLLKWVISILLLFGIAAGAYFWATGMIDSNYQYRSRLKDTPPAPGAALGEPSTRRIVFVLIDALRYDTSLNTDVMPTLNSLREIGASALMHSQPPSFSEPGYTTLLTGAWPELNDGPSINLDYEDIPTFTQDDLFSSAHRADWKTAISGYYWFEKLVPQNAVDFSFYTPGEDNAADEEVMAAALPWLEQDDAQLVLIHLDQVDYAGHHEGGPQSANWDAAAARTDVMLAQILQTLDLSQDTIVVLSDHGQIDAGGHGGQDPVCLLEPFVIAGAGVKPGVYDDIHMVDVAPTLAALMGIQLPASTQGEVKTDMVLLPASVLQALPQVAKAQQSGLVAAYAAAMGKSVDLEQIPASVDVTAAQTLLHDLRVNRLFSDRVKRTIPTALLLAVAITFLIRQRKNGSTGWLLGGLLFILLFNLRYALIDRKTYSLSSVTGETELIVYLAVTTSAAFLLTWLVVALWQRSFKGSPNTNGLKTLWLGYTTIFVAGLPVIASYLLNGALVTWTLPDYLTSFLCLIGLIQILILSLLTPLLAGITALITRLAQAKKSIGGVGND